MPWAAGLSCRLVQLSFLLKESFIMKTIAQALINDLFSAAIVNPDLIKDTNFRKIYAVLIRIVNG